MRSKLVVIFIFAGLMLTVYFFSQRATPRRGAMRVLERVCAGIVIFYLCGMATSLFGVTLKQSPLAAVAAGFWGLPGAALAAMAQFMP